MNIVNEKSPASAEAKKATVFRLADDAIYDNSRVRKNSKNKGQQGMAKVENTLNLMSGDISYEDLAKVPGISKMALDAKKYVSDISIFQKKDYVSSLKNADLKDINYKNLKLISQFSSTTSGKIVPSRISSVDKDTQKIISQSIQIARYLGLMDYVKY